MERSTAALLSLPDGAPVIPHGVGAIADGEGAFAPDRHEVCETVGNWLC